MSTVQPHRVIKFRFIRLISILIKTLTPPYAIKGPRHLFCTHEEREMDRWGEWTREQEAERGETEGSASPATAVVRFTIAALADIS